MFRLRGLSVYNVDHAFLKSCFAFHHPEWPSAIKPTWENPAHEKEKSGSGGTEIL